MNNCPECQPSTLTVHGEKKLRAEIVDYKELLEAERRVVGKRDGRIEQLETELNALEKRYSDAVDAWNREIDRSKRLMEDLFRVGSVHLEARIEVLEAALVSVRYCGSPRVMKIAFEALRYHPQEDEG